MILNQTKIAEFLEAAKPLIKFINENGHPHVSAIVTTVGAEFVEGVATVRTTEFVKD